MEPAFHWLDYVLCGMSLLMSLSIGVYYGIKGRFQKGEATEEFLMGGRKLHPFPVSLSLFVSWWSAIGLIGDPVEVYYNGAVYIFTGLGYCLALPPVAHIFAGTYNKMKLTSVNEYLNTRYSILAQRYVSAMTMTCGMLYLGIVIYAPSVALSQVTGLKEWISILLIGLIGTFYTVTGGIRAVVWADALQSGIMFIGLIAILIQGLINVGGFQNVMKIAQTGNRLNFTKNSWSPLVSVSAWSYLVGAFFRLFVYYSSSQTFVQRYCVLSSPRKAKLTVYLNMPMFIFLNTTFVMIGLTMYAYYHECDPLKDGRISNPDQMMPLFMLEMLGFLPGLPGIFLASIFAASLSSVSSIINAYAANILKDFVEPMYFKHKGKNLSDKVASIIAKATTFLFGILTTAFAFIILFVKVNLFPLTAKLSGMIIGPTGAIFSIGIWFTFVNSWSALLASMASLSICVWIGLGAFIYPPPSDTLPTSIDQCHNFSNLTFNSRDVDILGYVNISSIISDEKHDNNLSDIYNLSPLLYCPLGYILTLIFALIFSASKICLMKIVSRNKGKGDVITKDSDSEHVEFVPVGDKTTI